MIALADGQSITLFGIDANSLTESNFVIDQEPVLQNTGTMTIGDGAMLPLGGIIDNSRNDYAQLGRQQNNVTDHPKWRHFARRRYAVHVRQRSAM